LASELVSACEAAWSAIQRHHADVPDAVIVLGTGVDRGRLVKLGHWWDGRWVADGDIRGEVLLAGEALHLPPEEVFEVLLHEAAHGMNAARRVKDTSRGGRYHNVHFKSTAEELGLVVGRMHPYGWANTSIGEQAKERFAVEIRQLGVAMRIARRLSADVRLEQGRDDGREAGDSDGKRDRQPPLMCACGRRMRMAPSVLAQGPVICGLCGVQFTNGVEARPEQSLAASISATGNVIDGPFPPRRGDADVAFEPISYTPLFDADALTDLTPSQREGMDTLLRLGGEVDGALLLAEAGAWYADRRAGNEHALLGRTDTEVLLATEAARAMLKLDGTLTGRAITIAGAELLQGDLVVVGDTRSYLADAHGRPLPPVGVIGTVEHVDFDRGELVVGFAIHGRNTITGEGVAASALRHGYAERVDVTGAPLLDLRTLPAAPQPDLFAPVIELSP
jgi:hypothetical protein